MEQSQNKYYQGYSTSKQEYLTYKKAYKKAKKHTQTQHGGLFDSPSSMKNIIKRLQKIDTAVRRFKTYSTKNVNKRGKNGIKP